MPSSPSPHPPTREEFLGPSVRGSTCLPRTGDEAATRATHLSDRLTRARSFSDRRELLTHLNFLMGLGLGLASYQYRGAEGD